MKHSIVAPEVGESITEVSILKWAKGEGEAVQSGDLLLEIESDKATVEIVAENAGALNIVKPEGETIPVGEVVGYIDDEKKGAVQADATPSTPSASDSSVSTGSAPPPQPGPAARQMAAEKGISLNGMAGTGKDGRVTKGDLLQGSFTASTAPAASSTPSSNSSPVTPKRVDQEGDRRVPMKPIRKRIAERLLHAQHTAAILTTFNEVNMAPVMEVRKKYKEPFQKKYGVKLSFMSFFGRACVQALEELPAVNAFIDGSDVLYHDYVNLGIAVGTDRGLVMPVIRDCQKLSFDEMENQLGQMAVRARDGKLGIAEMSGGTFTISNGGTYGSMMSTPILNPPQSGILGMHNIVERPMAVDGKVVILPMMYLALSYDHRIIDGKEAVTFLVRVKEQLENPESLNLEFKNEL